MAINPRYDRLMKLTLCPLSDPRSDALIVESRTFQASENPDVEQRATRHAATTPAADHLARHRMMFGQADMRTW
jgi:hypothetical protein